ncbi:hypothetical protein [Campylobacter canadensis]|uniref:Uncharacterized protein n=1 Tax=Campylobacter canadensis TaxID=449520 RepID=A0ABS7WSK8_9BACT|nr:hypothetical protein [Campylobacter canadensis]MBZ7987743.1 hypothetical protein [Campylobacter canadensis]MBZ7994150.1 hypothetical protein [Campylobacter canadensis]MBZ7997380.1 hypothetical protein [Campylobacter canadensis]MBZ7999056.1 hypothetical protein [Campylobacter canadensis]MBZ7999482.1 hypothetical protein [Campylobacter canadensis]
MQEKALRIKYIRTLERCSKRFASALKNSNFNEELFVVCREQNIKLLEKCEKIFLDSTYSKELEKFVNDCCYKNYAFNELIAKYNFLEKLKNANQYKKEKHKLKIYEY